MEPEKQPKKKSVLFRANVLYVAVALSVVFFVFFTLRPHFVHGAPPASLARNAVFAVILGVFYWLITSIGQMASWRSIRSRAANAGITAENSEVNNSLATFMVGVPKFGQPVGILSFYQDTVVFDRTKRSFKAKKNAKSETFIKNQITNVTVGSTQGKWTGGLQGAVIDITYNGKRHRFVDMDMASISTITADIRKAGISVTE